MVCVVWLCGWGQTVSGRTKGLFKSFLHGSRWLVQPASQSADTTSRNSVRSMEDFGHKFKYDAAVVSMENVWGVSRAGRPTQPEFSL